MLDFVENHDAEGTIAARVRETLKQMKPGQNFTIVEPTGTNYVRHVCRSGGYCVHVKRIGYHIRVWLLEGRE